MTDREATPSTTALPPPLDEALGRLAAAVARLKAAGAQNAAAPRHAGEDESPSLPENRARLLDLDAALARVARLDQAKSDALERIGRAEAAVAAALRGLVEEEDVEEPPIEEAS